MANLETYGDLKQLLNSISKRQKGEKIISKGKEFALDQILGLIPGASNAKTAFDFIKTAISKPDGKKTNTWLDKLDVDDDMSQIVDDTVENGFMQAMTKSIESEQDAKPLEDDFNMNAKMVDYLKKTYSGRTVSGIQENNMKERFQQLAGIKEAINPAAVPPTTSTTQPEKGEIKTLRTYLQSTGKSALGQINDVKELENV
jgi:copper homeostasis protein CutC